MQQASIWRRVGIFLVGAIVIASLFVPLGLSGLWAPHELNVADWGRRVAVSLMGAEQLAASASTNEVPTVEEVGKGELPVLVIALSLKLFGMHYWAARLPMALFGLLGVLFTALVCWRLNSRKSALWASLALVTMPLYFVHARSALGDIATMALLAGAFAGFALALFDSRASSIDRVGFWVLGAACATLGFFCRGALINVAVPGLGVGLAWLFMLAAQKAEYPGRSFGTSDGLGAATLAIGLLGAGVGILALILAQPQDYWLALGGRVNEPRQFTTHDFVVRYLGHGLFPWSAFAPLALGLLLRAPRGDHPQKLARGSLRLSLLLTLSLAVGAYALVAPRTDLWPFGAVFAVAALIALSLEEFELRPQGAPMLAMASAALLVLLYKDFDNSPDRVLSAFALSDTSLPESIKNTSVKLMLFSAGLSLGAFALLSVERIGFLAAALRWLNHKVGPVRGWLAVVALSFGGLVLSAGYYPRLALQLSPKSAFDAYERHATPGEPLAALGTDQRSALYVGKDLKSLSGEQAAVSWLTQAGNARRWLLVESDKLASLNSRFRRETGERKNLPIIEKASADTLLASNRLEGGETNNNPFTEVFPKEKPAVQHPLHAEFEGKLRLLGWALLDASGKPASKLRINESYDFVIYYEVLGKITKDWRTFIHLDTAGARFNGDHDTLGGDYPFRLWHTGDFVVDKHRIKLDSSYPLGEYQVHFGLFSGKERLKVTVGPHQENRLQGGTIQVVR